MRTECRMLLCSKREVKHTYYNYVYQAVSIFVFTDSTFEVMCKSIPDMDLVIVLDSSSSINETNWATISRKVRGFIRLELFLVMNEFFQEHFYSNQVRNITLHFAKARNKSAEPGLHTSSWLCKRNYAAAVAIGLQFRYTVKDALTGSRNKSSSDAVQAIRKGSFPNRKIGCWKLFTKKYPSLLAQTNRLLLN